MRAVRRVWVTRAEPGAARTAARLLALGFEPLVAPLLAIRPLAPLIDLTGVAALAFTSVNGVTAFAALTASLAAARDKPVFAVGDATAEAAREAGFTDVRSASGDARALARLIAEAEFRGAVLAPGATEPAADLAALLAGEAVVRALAVYEAVETGVPAPAGFDAVLVHSPRAARALAMHAWALDDGIAVAISPAAAEPLEDFGLREIRIADTPTDTALIEGLGEPGRHV